VHRHHVEFFVAPRESGASISYLDGMYGVRIKGPAGTVVWGMEDIDSWAGGLMVFRLGHPPTDGITLPAGVTPVVESTAVDPLGRHVITVASYDDNNGVSGSPQGDIADSSGRGPLRDFSDPAAPLPVIPKPDIAAPGVDIMSAEGADTEQLLPTTPAWRSGIRFHSLGGTSMAAPMVAGTIALMLDKSATLHTTRVRQILTAAARAAVNPATAPDSTNAYGAGRVDAMTSHNNTP
jgi:subtilisin family serine protease